MNKNRLEIIPLVEENMNQMVDGSFSINQLNGHITLKREDEYISKTKEMATSIIDLKEFKKDLQEKIIEDKKKPDEISELIKNLEDGIEEAKKKVEEIRVKLEKYEKIAKDIDKQLNEIDEYLRGDFLLNAQILYASKMNSNINLLGNLMIQNELMDRISDNENYFESFIHNMFIYTDENGVKHNYNTINIHADNKVEIEKRVNSSTYDTYVNNLIAKYNKVKNDHGLSGSYKIKGAVYS